MTLTLHLVNVSYVIQFEGAEGDVPSQVDGELFIAQPRQRQLGGTDTRQEFWPRQQVHFLQLQTYFTRRLKLFRDVTRSELSSHGLVGSCGPAERGPAPCPAHLAQPPLQLGHAGEAPPELLLGGGVAGLAGRHLGTREPVWEVCEAGQPDVPVHRVPATPVSDVGRYGFQLQ